MSTKVIIEVRGGTVVNVSSSEGIDIVILDYDNINNGSPAWNGNIYGEDALFESGTAHELFTDSSDPVEMEIKAQLKRIKF